MLAEPFNAILWHAAVVANSCSAEIAERGSFGLSNRLLNASTGFLYIVSVTNDQFIASSKNGTEPFVFNLTSNRHEIIYRHLPPPDLNSISTVLKTYDLVINGLTQDAVRNHLDFIEFDLSIHLDDSSLFQLNLFNEVGLQKLFDMNKLIHSLDVVLNPTTFMSLGSRRNTSKLFQAAKGQLTTIQISLTNALVFDVASRKG
jgi:hypothetical protein